MYESFFSTSTFGRKAGNLGFESLTSWRYMSIIVERFLLWLRIVWVLWNTLIHPLIICQIMGKNKWKEYTMIVIEIFPCLPAQKLKASWHSFEFSSQLPHVRSSSTSRLFSLDRYFHWISKHTIPIKFSFIFRTIHIDLPLIH